MPETSKYEELSSHEEHWNLRLPEQSLPLHSRREELQALQGTFYIENVIPNYNLVGLGPV